MKIMTKSEIDAIELQANRSREFQAKMKEVYPSKFDNMLDAIKHVDPEGYELIFGKD